MAIEKSEKRLHGILALQLTSLGVVVLSFWLAVSSYSSLPHTYAVHFDLSGVPNGWSTKSWGSILHLPVIQLGLFLLMAGLTFWTASSPNSLAYINVPINKEQLSDEQKEKVRWLAAFGMSLISLCVLLVFAFINYALLHSEITGRSPSLGWMVFAIVVLLLCIIVSVIWLTSAIKRVGRQ